MGFVIGWQLFIGDSLSFSFSLFLSLLKESFIWDASSHLVHANRVNQSKKKGRKERNKNFLPIYQRISNNQNTMAHNPFLFVLLFFYHMPSNKFKKINKKKEQKKRTKKKEVKKKKCLLHINPMLQYILFLLFQFQ